VEQKSYKEIIMTDNKKLAFLGPYGTFTEEAAKHLLDRSRTDFSPLETIADVLLAVEQGKADIGVVPIENSIEGSVNMTLDWLVHEVDLTVIGELIYPIKQHLIVSSLKVGVEGIQKIMSHPQAIAQCRRFIQAHLPHAEIEYTTSTAEAVRLIQASGRMDWAAIGTTLAAERYGMHLLREGIQDYDNNYTRFIAVSKQPQDMAPSDRTKTSLLITLPTDFPGALHQVLSAFAWRRINMSRIESRPTKKLLGTYYFFIDVEMALDNVLLQGAIGEMEAIGSQVRILGSYPLYNI
jgi:prephenate dehydratase